MRNISRMRVGGSGGQTAWDEASSLTHHCFLPRRWKSGSQQGWRTEAGRGVAGPVPLQRLAAVEEDGGKPQEEENHSWKERKRTEETDREQSRAEWTHRVEARISQTGINQLFVILIYLAVNSLDSLKTTQSKLRINTCKYGGKNKNYEIYIF